ncbi:MAG: YkgB family protein [Pyrinomonadaceae bacterium]
MAARVEHVERPADSDSIGYTLENIGEKVIRYGLVIVLLSVGALKFTAYEAEGIQGFVANSPLMSWAYSIFSVRSWAAVIGTIELLLGIMIALRSVAPLVSAIGSIGSILMFLTTLSFVLTTPGMWQPGYGFPFPSVVPGQFLLKDIVLVGAAIWTAGEALRAANTNHVTLRNDT